MIVTKYIKRFVYHFFYIQDIFPPIAFVMTKAVLATTDTNFLRCLPRASDISFSDDSDANDDKCLLKKYRHNPHRKFRKELRSCCVASIGNVMHLCTARCSFPAAQPIVASPYNPKFVTLIFLSSLSLRLGFERCVLFGHCS